MSRPSNLNSGPWERIKAERRRRFPLYYKGWDAGMNNQAVAVPGHLTLEEKEEIRKGWTAARRATMRVE